MNRRNFLTSLLAIPLGILGYKFTKKQDITITSEGFEAPYIVYLGDDREWVAKQYNYETKKYDMVDGDIKFLWEHV